MKFARLREATARAIGFLQAHAIELAALAVSVAAAAFTFIQAWQTVKVAKLQTLPVLQLEEYPDEADHSVCDGRRYHAVDGARVVCFQNVGAGPALITGVDVFLQGRLLAMPQGLNWKVLRPQLPLPVEESLLETTTFANFSVLPSGKAINIARFKAASAPDANLGSMIQARTLGFALCYCNFYTDCFYTSLTLPRPKVREEDAPNSCQSRPEFRRIGILEPSVGRLLIEGAEPQTYEPGR